MSGHACNKLWCLRRKSTWYLSLIPVQVWIWHEMSVTRVYQTTTIKTEIIFHSYSYLSWRTRRRAPTLENESRWHGDRDTPFPLAFRKGEIDLIIIPEWNKMNNSGSDNFRTYSMYTRILQLEVLQFRSHTVVETPIIISHAGSPRDTSKHIVVSFFHLFHFLFFYLNLHCFRRAYWVRRSFPLPPHPDASAPFAPPFSFLTLLIASDLAAAHTSVSSSFEKAPDVSPPTWEV
jgi:hypothetical protein